MVRQPDATMQAGMIGLLSFALAALASPFKLKSRLEAENAVPA
jgi:hypothetical protein